MKMNLCLFIVSCMASTTVLAANAPSTHTDPMGFAGKYICKNVDSHDGHFTSTLEIIRDDKASDQTLGFGAYQANGTATLPNGQSDTYTGYLAVQGNDVGANFGNAADSTDHGVGVGKIYHEKDSTGKIKTIYKGTYFQPAYERDAKNPGGRGTWDCVMTSQNTYSD